MSKHEKLVIEFESARNAAMEEFYVARPQLERSRQWEFMFEGGFRMAWELKNKQIDELQESCLNFEAEAVKAVKERNVFLNAMSKMVWFIVSELGGKPAPKLLNEVRAIITKEQEGKL